MAAVVRGHLARLYNSFTPALRTAVRRGEIPASVDPAGRAKLLVATSQGLMAVGKANPDEGVCRATKAARPCWSAAAPPQPASAAPRSPPRPLPADRLGNPSLAS